MQELKTGIVSGNLLTGLGLDEYFQRTSSSEVVTYLADALGSTVALTDTNGSTLTSYTYDPFGNTGTSGTSENNFNLPAGKMTAMVFTIIALDITHLACSALFPKMLIQKTESAHTFILMLIMVPLHQ